MTVATDARKTGVNAGMTLLAASAAGASVTGTASETALATVTIPGGAMGLNGGVFVMSSWTVTNSANNKTLRVRFGGASGTAHMQQAVTAVASVSDARRIRNRNATNSQVSSFSISASGFGTSSGALATSSVDTTQAVDIVFTGGLANTGETITLESYEVWLLP